MEASRGDPPRGNDEGQRVALDKRKKTRGARLDEALVSLIPSFFLK